MVVEEDAEGGSWTGRGGGRDGFEEEIGVPVDKAGSSLHK